MDPVNNVVQSGGFRRLSNTTGLTTGAYTVVTGIGENGLFAKAQSLGDAELTCGTPAYLEIGNYAWLDENEDGIQDPCEPAIAGLTVGLYAADGTLLATTTTNADGEYYFSEDGAMNQTWVTTGDGLEPTTDYLIVFGDGQFDVTTGLDLGAAEGYQLTMNDTGQAPNADLNDSDVDGATLTTAMGDLAAGLPFIPFTTPDNGVDHSLDVGFVLDCPFVRLEATSPTVCSTGPVVLASLIDSIYNTAAFDYEWSTSGDGMFFDAGDVENNAQAAAVIYRPGSGDAVNGSVVLTLSSTTATTPSSCPPATDELTINILKVDCGTFPWEGQ